MKDDPTFKFGPHVRTIADWLEAGPTDMFRLNAEIHAAAHGSAAVVLAEGGLAIGVMVYYRKEKEQVMGAAWFSDSKVVNETI